MRAAPESGLSKLVPLNVVLSVLIVHSTFLAHEVSWKCTAPSMLNVQPQGQRREPALGSWLYLLLEAPPL